MCQSDWFKKNGGKLKKISITQELFSNKGEQSRSNNFVKKSLLLIDLHCESNSWSYFHCPGCALHSNSEVFPSKFHFEQMSKYLSDMSFVGLGKQL